MHGASMGQWGTNINVVVLRIDQGLFHAQGRCPVLSHAAPSGLGYGAPMGQWGTNINVVVLRIDQGLFHAQGRCSVLPHAAPSGLGL
jgi:hypothetical protein